MASICILITTYNRPDQCLSLLKSISECGDIHRVVVMDDCSTKNYGEVASFIASQLGWVYSRSQTNCGKRKYWLLINRGLNIIRGFPRPDFCYVLQDDVSICSDFFSKSINLWNSIGTAQKATLLLLKDRRSMGLKGIWTGQKIRRHKDVSKIQFVDCSAFLTTPRVLDFLNWKIDPIPTDRWLKNSDLSSGVGEQLSHRLHSGGWSLFVSNRSLVRHSHQASVMNPSERSRNPLVEMDFIDEDRKTVSIASIARREKFLLRVINQLSPQVDHINVYLNGYQRVPAFLIQPHISIATSQEFGDIGDRGKFFWSDKINGIHFTCDDDIFYPDNYVTKMVSRINYYNKCAAIGCHAALINGKIDTYYKSRTVLHFTQELSSDRSVHVLGTGTMAYHTDTIKISPDIFQTNNMADLWFASYAQKMGIPLISISRSGMWLSPLNGSDGDSIYSQSIKHSGAFMDTGVAQTVLARKCAPWRVFKP